MEYDQAWGKELLFSLFGEVHLSFSDVDSEFQALLEDVLDDKSIEQSFTFTVPSHSDSSSGCSSPLIVTKKPDRRRSRNPVYMPALRILKRDIRRRYGEMFINTVNSHDPSLLAKFLTEFCAPNVRFLTKEPPANSSPESIETFRKSKELHKKPDLLIGAEQITSMLGISFITSPDVIIRSKASKLSIREGENGATIISDVSFRGTSVLDFRFEPRHDSENPFASPMSSYPEFNHALPAPSIVRFIPIPEPIELRMDGYFVMRVDEMNRIISFQMNCVSVSERSVGCC